MYPSMMKWPFRDNCLRYIYLPMTCVSDGGMCRHNLHSCLPDHCDSSTACKMYHLKPLHPVIVTFCHHMYIPSQPTTSNDSCDRLNPTSPTSFLHFSLVFHGNDTHPSNDLHMCSFKHTVNMNKIFLDTYE